MFFFSSTAGDSKTPLVAAEEEDDEVPGQYTHLFICIKCASIVDINQIGFFLSIYFPQAGFIFCHSVF